MNRNPNSPRPLDNPHRPHDMLNNPGLPQRGINPPRLDKLRCRHGKRIQDVLDIGVGFFGHQRDKIIALIRLIENSGLDAVDQLLGKPPLFR